MLIQECLLLTYHDRKSYKQKDVSKPVLMEISTIIWSIKLTKLIFGLDFSGRFSGHQADAGAVGSSRLHQVQKPRQATARQGPFNTF